MRNVIHQRKVVAQIDKTEVHHKWGHDQHRPWAMKSTTGRIDRFEKVEEAREEARKTWGARVEIRRVESNI